MAQIKLNESIEATMISLPAKIEAILYLKGKPLSIKDLVEVTGEQDSVVEEALFTLMATYAQRDTALKIEDRHKKYSLELRPGLEELVKNLIPVDLSLATLRTLATIALKKRILQSELIDVRGSGAYDHIKELISQNFVERKRQSEGRSYWLTLSEKFHRTFSIIPDIGSTDPPQAA